MSNEKKSVTEFVTASLNECNEFFGVTREGHSGSGLGNASETHVFGVIENNSAGADVPKYSLESKCCDKDSKALTTMFTNAPKINMMISEDERAKGRPKAATRSLMENHSVRDDEKDRQALYFDLKTTKTTKVGNSDFSITRDEDHIWITADGVPVAGWTTETIERAVRSKIGGGASAPDGKGAVVIQKGKSKLVNAKTNMHKHQIDEAIVYEGFLGKEFFNAFDDGTITVSLRAHGVDKGKPSLHIRDHGTAFRIAEGKIARLFEKSTVAFKR